MAAKEELPMALRAAYLALHRGSDAKFAAHGVTADQFVLLATLARGGQALTQRQLAQRMLSDCSTVRAMLVLLEKSGYVGREPHPHDARARTVRLTRAGKQKFRQLWRSGESIRDDMLGSLNSNESETLVRLLQQVAGALQSPLPGAATGAPLALAPQKEGS